MKMERILLIRYGEIILKGLNRPVFEDILMKNIRRALRGHGKFTLTRSQAIIYLKPEDDSRVDGMVEVLQKLFGVVSVVVAYQVGKSMDAVREALVPVLTPVLSQAKTFKVEAKRSDKKFPLKSPQICEEVGGDILERFPHLTVDVHNPDVTVYVEIRDEHAFLHTGRIPGTRGLPTGTGGRAVLLLSGGIDSPVAGYLMGRRGVKLEAVHFFSYPYTSERAKDKVLKLAKLLSPYLGGMRVHIVPFTDIQLKIREKCPEEHMTLIMRRFMMQIAERIARANDCTALVTGESLGQVASQTIGALAVTNDAVSMPILQPLIGLDKDDIVEWARKIGTFETSILPYEDCCTVFTPKHPVTKPKLEKILRSQSYLDSEALIQAAIDGVEMVEC